MKIEELRNRKTALGLTNEMISRASDIPLSTVQKIMSGATKAPRKLTLEAIEDTGSHRVCTVRGGTAQGKGTVENGHDRK